MESEQLYTIYSVRSDIITSERRDGMGFKEEDTIWGVSSQAVEQANRILATGDLLFVIVVNEKGSPVWYNTTQPANTFFLLREEDEGDN